MNARSARIVEALGPERSKKIHLWVGRDEFPHLKKPEENNTHFCAYRVPCACVKSQWKRSNR